MAKQNQGFRQDLNLLENVNSTLTLSNLGGPGIANDLRIIQNNLRNISTVSYNSVSNGFFFFGANNTFIFTNDDVVTVSTSVNVGSTILSPNTNYFVCNSDGKTQFKLSSTPSSVGFTTISVTSVFPTTFNFVRKDPVTQDNVFNFLKPQIQDDQFSYLSGGSINAATNTVQNNLELASYIIQTKYKGNADTTTNDNITVEGVINIEDPANLNTGTSGLNDAKSPGVFIGDVRAFSGDNNPWTKVGTALSTSSSSVSVGELYFSNNISISGISTSSASRIAVTSFSHKLPVSINGETYYLLLNT